MIFQLTNTFSSNWMFFTLNYIFKTFSKPLDSQFSDWMLSYFFFSVCSNFFFKTEILGADWLGDCVYCFENQSPLLFFKTLFLHCFEYKSLKTIHYIWCSFGAYLTKKSRAHIVLTQMDALHWTSKYFQLCSFVVKWNV